MGRAAREIRRAVDGIDHPDRRARRADKAGPLLADESVAGERLNEARLDEPLDLAVDFGDEILRSLEADCEGAAIEEAALGQKAGFRATAQAAWNRVCIGAASVKLVSRP